MEQENQIKDVTMPTGETFAFEKLSDFFQLAPAQFERMLADFRCWHALGYGAMLSAKIVNECLGVPNAFNFHIPCFKWIDDGADNITMNVEAKMHNANGDVVQHQKMTVETTARDLFGK